MTERWIGIDVAKRWLDVASTTETRVVRFANDAAGVAALLSTLSAPDPQLVVLEATGGHERLVATALAGSGIPVAVVNPLHVRHFARSAGKLAKTDALDAQILALFGERMQPEPRPQPTPPPKIWRRCWPGDGNWWICRPPRRTAGRRWRRACGQDWMRIWAG